MNILLLFWFRCIQFQYWFSVDVRSTFKRWRHLKVWKLHVRCCRQWSYHFVHARVWYKCISSAYSHEKQFERSILKAQWDMNVCHFFAHIRYLKGIAYFTFKSYKINMTIQTAKWEKQTFLFCTVKMFKHLLAIQYFYQRGKYNLLRTFHHRDKANSDCLDKLNRRRIIMLLSRWRFRMNLIFKRKWVLVAQQNIYLFYRHRNTNHQPDLTELLTKSNKCSNLFNLTPPLSTQILFVWIWSRQSK